MRDLCSLALTRFANALYTFRASVTGFEARQVWSASALASNGPPYQEIDLLDYH